MDGKLKKDYYKILNVPHNARNQEIKKAFRQLAMRYHPDKNEGDSLAASYFRDVHEAYQVLSDENQRSAYNQDCWYNNRRHNALRFETLTPHMLLHKSQRLRKYISSLNDYATDRDALFEYMTGLLTEESLGMLIECNEPSTKHRIVENLLNTGSALPLHNLQQITDKLSRLGSNDARITEMIDSCMKEYRAADLWKKYQGLAVLIFTLMLCGMIYLVSR